MRWSSVQTRQRENFISNRVIRAWKLELNQTSPARFGKRAYLKTTCKLCKIIQQWPVICITDSNTSYMQLSLLCFMDLPFVSNGIRSEFILSCVS
jgi:hypothetical protein